MTSKNPIKSNTSCIKQHRKTNPNKGNGRFKISEDRKETTDGVIQEDHTPRMSRTGNHGNKEKKTSSPVQKSVPRSVQRSPVPLHRSRSPRQKRSREKGKTDRTRLSIQSHVARISGGIRDGIVDKTKTTDDKSKEHPEQKRRKDRQNREQDTIEQTRPVREQSKIQKKHTTSKILKSETQHMDDRIKESQKVKHVAKKNLQPGTENKKEMNQLHKREKREIETGQVERNMDSSIHDKATAKPDSSRSITESEYCYSSDPDWDTSVWSESSSEDSQPGTYAARIQNATEAGDSDIDMRDHAFTQGDRSSQCTSSGSEDSSTLSEISSTDESLSEIGIRDDLDIRSPFRSAHDQSSADSVSSYSPQTSDTDLVSKGDIVESQKDRPTESLVGHKRKRQKENATVQSKKSSTSGKAKEKRKTGSFNEQREARVDKRLSEVKTRKKDIDTRRVQSESVVRGYRQRKQRSSPSQRIDATAGRGQKRVRREKGFVNNNGKEKEFVKDKGKESGFVDKEKENGFVNDRGKERRGNGKEKDHKTMIVDTHKTDKERILTKVRSKETKTVRVRDDQSQDRMQKYKTDSKDKYKPKVESKSLVRFHLPNKDMHKEYPEESVISSDEAMICDGYPASSSASSIESELVSDTWDEDSEMGSHVGSARILNESRKCSGDKKGVRRQKSVKDIDKNVKKGYGQRLSESRLKGQQYRSQSKKVTDQLNTSDMGSRQKCLKAMDSKAKDIQKTSSMKFVKCQSTKLTNAVAERVPPKLRMYIAPVSSHPKSESELIKYVELQTKASARIVKSLKPGYDGKSPRTEISRPSGDKIMRTINGKPQMKTNTDTSMIKQNEKLHRNRISMGAMMKPANSESSVIKDKEPVNQCFTTKIKGLS